MKAKHLRKVALGNIAKMSSGGTPSRTVGSYWNGEIPWVKTTQIQNCIINKEDIDEFITEAGLKKSSAKLVPPGTIVLAMIGQGKTRGQVGYLTFEACTNQNAATIICGKQCDAWFLYQYLLFNYKNIRALSNSSGQGNLNLRLVEIIPILLPPLPEQKAIADVLSTWDTAIEKTERLIKAKERRFRGLMQRLMREKNRWKKVRIGSFLTESRIAGSNGFDAKKLTVKLYGNGVVAKSEKRLGSETTKYFIRKSGQFIYSKLDFLNGAFGLIPNELDGYESTLDLPAFDLSSEVSHEWFLYYVIRPEYYTQQIGLAKGQRKARRVSPTEFLGSKIPFPPIEEQSQIAETLSLVRREIELYQKTLEQFKTQKRGLMQKLLTGEWRVDADGEEVDCG